MKIWEGVALHCQDMRTGRKGASPGGVFAWENNRASKAAQIGLQILPEERIIFHYTPKFGLAVRWRMERIFP